MPYYASNGKISTDNFTGSIEITKDQYALALEGMLSGLVVSIDNGFKVSMPAPPILEPLVPPTTEELAARVLYERDGLLQVAAIRIAPLQDAVDIGRSTADEVDRLLKWKEYRVDLNRINEQEKFPDVIWPLSPEQAAAQ